MGRLKESEIEKDNKQMKKNRGWFRLKRETHINSTPQITVEQKSFSPSPFAYSRSSSTLKYDDKAILDVEGKIQQHIAELDKQQNAQRLRTAYGVPYFEGLEEDFPDDDSLQEVFTNELKNGEKKSTEFLNIKGRKYNRFEDIRTKQDGGKRFYDDDEDLRNTAHSQDGNSFMTCLSASSLMSGMYGIMDMLGVGGNKGDDKSTPVENIDVDVNKSQSKRL